MSLKSNWCSVMKFDKLNMDTDMDIVYVVINVHGYIKVSRGFPPYPSVCHHVGLLGSPLLLLFLV